MAETLTTRQRFADVQLGVFKADGVTPAPVDGVPVWASSDETVIKVTPSDDGMSAVIDSVAPGGPARITVSADADQGAGVVEITGVTDDITVVLDNRDQASVMTLTLGGATDKA